MKILSHTLWSTLLFSSSLLAVTLTPSLQDNSLIIYNSNIGLVHESRNLKLQKDDSQIRYEDVASSINTDSVNISLPKEVKLYSQQYRYDKLTQNKLLNAHIGKNVSARIAKDAKEFKTISATLLSNDGASCILRHKQEIIIVESKNIIFNNIPKELITKPSLVWNIENSQESDSKMSIDYLISNIKWKSNYILKLKKDKADLSGWISIDNRSGKAFSNTSLHVLAGEINRAYQPRQNYRALQKAVMMADAAPKVAHQAHEGYHFYTIPFKVNLANNENTQIKFITQDNINIKRKYTVRMSHPNYLNGEVKHDVSQYVTMKGFDFPFPKGIVRTYSNLKNTNILLGETPIKHTAKNTPISLKLGKNFDVKVTETLRSKNKSSWYQESDISYSIKNTSNEDKTLEILIPFTNNKADEITSKQSFTITKGNLVTFKVKVIAHSTKTFQVHYKSKIYK